MAIFKIRDDKDLEDLLDFGFIKNSFGYSDDTPCFERIFVDKDNRHINFCDEWYGDDFDRIEIFYELVVAGYVDKVEVINGETEN